jgi:hypothetical protein
MKYGGQKYRHVPGQQRVIYRVRPEHVQTMG